MRVFCAANLSDDSTSLPHTSDSSTTLLHQPATGQGTNQYLCGSQALVQLNPAGDFNPLPFDSRDCGRFRDRRGIRAPAGKGLVRVPGTNIQECVPALGSEDFGDHSLYRRPFVEAETKVGSVS